MNNVPANRNRDTSATPTSDGSQSGNPRRRLIIPRDVRDCILLGANALCVKTKPPEKWTDLTDRLYPIERVRRLAWFREFLIRVAEFYGPDIDADFTSNLWRDFCIAHHRQRLQIIAEKIGANYRPSIHLEGREHIDHAIAAGKGVILWYDSLRHQTVIGKRAIAEAGHKGLHLTSVNHGFSSSTFGRRFLNPIQTSVEDRYVLRKVRFEKTTTLAATREINSHLTKNGIVLITNNADTGRKFVHTRIGKSSRLPIATAPLNFAWKGSTALLPVAVIERRALSEYDVKIGAPLLVEGHDRETAFRAAAHSYGRYIEPIIRAHPEQWDRWV